MTKPLNEKVMIVTGAASGLGAEITHRLCREGAHVIMTDIAEASGNALAEEIRNAGYDVEFAVHDVANEDQWRKLYADVEQKWGRLDALVNNAGIAMFGLVSELTTEQWRRCIAIDLDSVFFGTKYALPLMRKGGGGSIVNMSSVAGLRGQANLSAYCAAKGGVRMFSKAVALECGVLKDGIRVNSLHPGIIDTPIFHTVTSDANVRIGKVGEGAAIDVAALAEVIVPLGRPGLPDEIASAVYYLVSDESRYVTGTEMVVDGGWNAG